MILAALGIALAAKPVSLTWHPQLGESHRYRVSVVFNYSSNATVEFRSNLDLTVVAVSPDGSYDLKSETSDAKMLGGADEQKLPPQPATVQKYDKNGLPIDVKPDTRDADPFADLLDHLTEFQSPLHPVDTGATWKNQVVGIKRGIFSRPRINYTLLRITEGADHPYAQIGVRAVSADQSELATGTVVLRRPDNCLMRMEEVIPNFWPEGANQGVNVHIIVQENKA